MNIEEFVKGFSSLFEDVEPGEITTETRFKELDEWDSLTALTVIGFAKTNYGKIITGSEVRKCETVKDLFDLVESK